VVSRNPSSLGFVLLTWRVQTRNSDVSGRPQCTRRCLPLRYNLSLETSVTGTKSRGDQRKDMQNIKDLDLEHRFSPRRRRNGQYNFSILSSAASWTSFQTWCQASSGQRRQSKWHSSGNKLCYTTKSNGKSSFMRSHRRQLTSEDERVKTRKKEWTINDSVKTVIICIIFQQEEDCSVQDICGWLTSQIPITTGEK